MIFLHGEVIVNGPMPGSVSPDLNLFWCQEIIFFFFLKSHKFPVPVVPAIARCIVSLHGLNPCFQCHKSHCYFVGGDTTAYNSTSFPHPCS